MAWISLFQKALNLGKVYKTKNLLPDIDTMTNELYNTKLSTSVFNSFTGSTSGETVDISGKLDKIIFNQYTGDTKNQINHISGVTDTKLNIINFIDYSGNTQIQLNNINSNKLDVSLFNQYTGSTTGNTIQFTGSLTDGVPTATEINNIIGTASSKGAGYQATIKDNNGSGLLYKIESDGTDWYYLVMTKAL